MGARGWGETESASAEALGGGLEALQMRLISDSADCAQSPRNALRAQHSPEHSIADDALSSAKAAKLRLRLCTQLLSQESVSTGTERLSTPAHSSPTANHKPCTTREEQSTEVALPSTSHPSSGSQVDVRICPGDEMSPGGVRCGLAAAASQLGAGDADRHWRLRLQQQERSSPAWLSTPLSPPGSSSLSSLSLSSSSSSLLSAAARGYGVGAGQSLC